MLNASFIFIPIIVIILLVSGTNKNWKFYVIFFIWYLIVLFISNSGFLELTDTLPPRMFAILLPTILLSVYFYKAAKNSELNLKYLFIIHVMRIPVELCLHQLYKDGLIPEAMTFEGWNYDILSGVSALIILIVLYVRKDTLKEKFLLYWNYAGLLLLAIILLTSIMAAPSPIQVVGLDPPNLAILKFPVILLAAIIVPCVAISHFLMIRQLSKSV